MSDTLIDILNKAFEEHINKLKKQGVSDEEVLVREREFDFTEVLETMIQTATDNTVQFFQSTMYERVMEERATIDEFIAHQDQIWGKGFVASEAMYIIAVESAEAYGEYLADLPNNQKDDKKYRYLALRELHGRSCQVFLEILCLMKSGFADGAYARWRTMYELSIVAEFIWNNEEYVAQAFIQASEGNDNWYNWAKEAPCFKSQKKNITFSAIESKCNLLTDDWKKQHELAHKIVHASPQATFKRLGIFKPNGNIIAGHTDYGIVSAAENSAISLSKITTLFLTLIPYGDGLVHSRCLSKWVKEIKKHYYNAEDNSFTNAEPKNPQLMGIKLNSTGENTHANSTGSHRVDCD